MNQLTRVSMPPRPVREVRVVIVAGRDDDEACLERIVTGFHSPATMRRIHLVNRRAEPHIDPMMVYVVLEVPDPVVTGRIFSVTTVARTIPGQRRHPRRRVEPQPVVTGSPARAYPVASFEHTRSNAYTAQGCRGCQPRRTRAADDGLRHEVIVIADAIRRP
jgi:hypothetical protein